jgi:formylglycine-generating enzyme required for sulfatase activity
LPTLDQKWQPYSLPSDGGNLAGITNLETQALELQSLNLLENVQNPLSEPEQSPAPTISEASSTSSTLSESNIHPIIEEIMQNMVEIPAGSFEMGDAQIREESPVHTVTLTQPFYMGKYMVTQELWKKVMGSLPGMPPKQRSPKFPILYVNYYNIMDFINKLNTLPGGGGFDLPTDAQWEYACRAGSTGNYCFGNNQRLLEQYAWTKNNARGQIHDVGLLKPNAWGLYDMHGLEFELVKDGLRKYTTGPVVDPIGPLDGQNCVCRGGHWGRFPFPPKLKDHFFRCGVRYYPVPKDDISYRLSFRLIRKTTL